MGLETLISEPDQTKKKKSLLHYIFVRTYITLRVWLTGELQRIDPKRMY
jgi:hypothetical protein